MVATRPDAATPTSTTKRILIVLLAALLAGTAGVWGTTWWAFQRAHDTAAMVREQTAPAIVEIALARSALVAADAAAITSFGTQESRLVGPGQEFQDQVAIASQSLTQVAEHNVVGEFGSRQLQLINALLVVYTGLIGQAHNLQDAGTTLGVRDLWDASGLMHAPDSGILAELDRLLVAQQRAFRAQLSESGVHPATAVLWGIPIAILFGLLVAGHRILGIRFRRTLSLGLLVAAGLLAAVTVVASLTLVAQHRLHGASDKVDQVVREWRWDTDAADLEGQRHLRTLLEGECDDAGPCGATVARFQEGLTQPDRVGGVDERQLAAVTREANEATADAGDTAGFGFLIHVLIFLLAASTLWGLWPHIDDYRYRPI